MRNKDELCGIIDALGALSIEEIYIAAKEISLLRGGVPLTLPSIKDICAEAEKEHLVAVVSWEEIEGLEKNDISYYILGPNAFPEIPFELSEVIDILEMSTRQVDLSRAASRFSKNLHKKVNNLENKIDSIDPAKFHPEDLENLEHRYSDILNQYYDYSFWLPGDMSAIGAEIQQLSKRIEVLKSA
ncbi:DUF7109 family protein [Methanolobus halotolerans]|uniref:Uncharacterized protein n=1 Tax=Methanolobus halotolerans TaxID=2052935 RepID=A0A4E0Q014_9EURY|nr:hypothetical protein [Methanolobus halotolerans]TGC11356.1 hypothetical protein CUN85_00270 [Methanolobus halotolerans]